MKNSGKTLTVMLAAVLLAGGAASAASMTDIYAGSMTVYAAENSAVIESGECGDQGSNVTYTLNSSGVLTISGSGRMADCLDDLIQSPFYHNSAIQTVNIGKGITYIGGEAFYQCPNLTSVNIADTVTEIGAHAFHGCQNLKDISIPNTVHQIDRMAFEDTAWYNSQQDGLIYIGKVVYKYKGQMPEDTEIVVKADTKGIAAEAFWYGKNLKKITLPEGMRTIGECAFYNCNNLENIYLPSTVINIGREAFGNCDGFTSVNIPEGVTKIEAFTFAYCDGLTNMIIPEGVTSIGHCAFNGCDKLENITIPDSVEEISTYAFTKTAWYDHQPDGLVYAGKVAYQYKGNMSENTRIELKPDTKGVAGLAFYNTNLKEMILPEGLKTIGENAFGACKQLTDIKIPESVEVIGDFAFYSCPKLNSLALPKNIKSIGRWAFAYSYNPLSNQTEINQDFILYGYRNTAAEKYAQENSIPFRSIDVSVMNSSSISSENIYLGDKIILRGNAFGGSGNFQYAYYYKKTTDKKWVTAKGFSETTSVSIKPAMANDYEICIKAKDADGKVEKKYFQVKVAPKLVNQSSVNAENIKLGKKVGLRGAASGGSGDYTYAYYYKKTTDRKWVTAADFSNCTFFNIKPAMAKDYDICIKVKDSSGKVEKKYFTVKVSQ